MYSYLHLSLLWLPLLLSFSLLPVQPCAADTIDDSDKVDYVIAISADGLVPSKVTADLANLPNFRRLRKEGAYTDNARNEYESSQTTPNHASMLTGLSISQHKYKEDSDNGDKISAKSIFDAVSDAGGKTCLFATKEKFQLFDRSWPIRRFEWTKKSSELNKTFMNEMKGGNPCNYVLLHWRDADSIGHRYKGADTKFYKEAVRTLDQYLGQIFKLIDSSSRYRGNTAIVVTGDHGFGGENHSDRSKRGNYEISFYVWGPSNVVDGGADLYDLNKRNRQDPNKSRPDNSGIQPIRCQDSAVIAADFLGVDGGTGRLQRKKLDLIVGGKSSGGRVPAPSPAKPSPTKPSPAKLRPHRPIPRPSQTSATIIDSRPSTNMIASNNDPPPISGIVLYTHFFAENSEYVGLQRILDPAAPLLGGANNRYVGEMQVPEGPSSSSAYYNAKPYGGIDLQAASVLRLQAYVHLSAQSVKMDTIDFSVIIRTDGGVTLRGYKMYLAPVLQDEYIRYDTQVSISDFSELHQSSIEQVRVKVRNLASEQPAFTVLIAGIQIEMVQ